MAIKLSELQALLQDYVDENEGQLESDNFLVGQDITIQQLCEAFNDLLTYAVEAKKVDVVEGDKASVSTTVPDDED